VLQALQAVLLNRRCNSGRCRAKVLMCSGWIFWAMLEWRTAELGCPRHKQLQHHSHPQGRERMDETRTAPDKTDT
jgi:hypothetical protein